MTTSAEATWLLAFVAKKDRAAFERLYAATSGRLHAVALRILERGDLAADVVRDTYLDIWSKAATYDPDTLPPLVWMTSLARRRARDLARARSAGDGTGMEEGASTETTPPDIPTQAPAVSPARPAGDDLRRLLAALGRLEPDRQRMILSAYFTGATRERLAADFDLPVELVRVQLRYALADLDEYLSA